MSKDIGEIVRGFRLSLPGNVTQAQFGKLVEAPASVISDIENNKREPSKKVASNLAKLTGKPIETFFRE